MQPLQSIRYHVRRHPLFDGFLHLGDAEVGVRLEAPWREPRAGQPLARAPVVDEPLVYGVWIMVYGLWFMVHGLWFMDFGLLVMGNEQRLW